MDPTALQYYQWHKLWMIGSAYWMPTWLEIEEARLPIWQTTIIIDVKRHRSLWGECKSCIIASQYIPQQSCLKDKFLCHLVNKFQTVSDEGSVNEFRAYAIDSYAIWSWAAFQTSWEAYNTVLRGTVGRWKGHRNNTYIIWDSERRGTVYYNSNITLCVQ